MFVIVGLGNPGVTYEKTYHNMGFMAVDAFAKQHNISFSKKKHNALYAETRMFGEKVVLIKPQTFMNNSGQSVAELVRKLKVNTANMLVVFDDVDIPVGSVRLREKGTAGSHNGIKSIIEHLGTTDFPRLKLGIGDKYFNLADYVLSKVKAEHAQSVNDALTSAVEIIEKFIEYKGEINRVH